MVGREGVDKSWYEDEERAANKKSCECTKQHNHEKNYLPKLQLEQVQVPSDNRSCALSVRTERVEN